MHKTYIPSLTNISQLKSTTRGARHDPPNLLRLPLPLIILPRVRRRSSSSSGGKRGHGDKILLKSKVLVRPCRGKSGLRTHNAGVRTRLLATPERSNTKPLGGKKGIGKVGWARRGRGRSGKR